MEAVNKIIKHNLKTKLEENKGVWADELPKVLWAYKMTSRTSIEETSFSLAYRVEAMIPVEVSIPSIRHETYDQAGNQTLQCYELNLLEEKCDHAALRITSYKNWFESNSKVKEIRFREGDLVLRKVLPNTKEVNVGVLGSNWEGPYVIEEAM